jgi:hypothetical protein
MSTVRGRAHHTLATPVQVTVRPITLALAGLLVVMALALTITLAGNAGNNDEAGGTKSVRVTPSAPLPPSPVERHQKPGLNGPGMRP